MLLGFNACGVRVKVGVFMERFFTGYKQRKKSLFIQP